MMVPGIMGTCWYEGGSLLMVVFWILVIIGIIFISKWSIDRGKGKAEGDSALEILKKRYAKGEINKTEYEEKKKDIL